MREKSKRLRFACASSIGTFGMAAALAFAPSQAGAQVAETSDPAETAAETTDSGGLGEIIVTAQRRAENLQDVPISVTAITTETLDATGIDTTRDLPQLVPSVQFTRSGASALIFVRGVGTTNAAVGEEGANAVYVDGVYLADLAQGINNFNNVARIEVLKGPQGTLFGRNATGGLIHIITREPGNELVANGEFGFANYDTVNSQLYVGGPITEGISADIAFTTLHQHKGWGRYLASGRKAHIQDYQGVRSKLVIRPSEAVKFTLAGDYYTNKDNLALAWKIDPGVLGTGGFTGPPGYDTTANDYALTRQKIRGISLTGEADLGFATLTSISAYRKADNKSNFDVDGGPLPLVRIGFSSGSKSIQQEIRLASTDTKPFSWQVGAFYLRIEATNDSLLSGAAFPAILRGQHILADLKTDSYAAFAEATYAITPTTHLTGGLRYTTDRRHFVGSQANVLASGAILSTASQDSRLNYDAWTYRASLRQEITDRINVYASFNRGFKSGSYSLQNPLNAPYLPQYIDAYELGFKSELFDRRLRLNLAGFHYVIDDYQVRSAAVANPGASLVLNAATVKVDGVELEFEAAPTDGLRLFGGATFLNSRFAKFGGPNSEFQAPIIYPQPATCPANLRGTRDPGVLSPGARIGGYQTCFGDVSGNDTPNAPDFTASLGAGYTFPVGRDGEVRLAALYSYNSGYVFDPDNRLKQGDYNLLNASVEYRPTENVGIEIWGRNLTETLYSVQKLTTGTGTTTALGAPRTYGVTLDFKF